MQFLPSGHPKISYFINIVVDKNIGWFQIPMNNVEPMKIVKTLANLKEHIE